MITQFCSPVPEIRTRLGQVGHDRSRLVPAIERAAEDLGLRVTVPLAEALQRTIAWLRFMHGQ